MNTNDPSPRRMLRPVSAATYLGVSRATIWRLRKGGKLPEPIHISERAVAWPIETLDAYIEAQAREVH